jgi:L-iditol 2-dehydrogenase
VTFFLILEEVILKTLSVGICGSDVHFWTHGAIGDFVVTEPLVLGHETCAEVIEVGDGVTNVKVGDIVGVEPGIPCRFCINCKGGRYNICPEVAFHGAPPTHGSLSRCFKHSADLCFV